MKLSVQKCELLRKNFKLYTKYMYTKRYKVRHMTATLTTRASDKLARDVEELAEKEQLDKSAMIRRLLADAVEMKKREEAIELYKAGKTSLRGAAKIAKISLWEMIDLVSKEGLYLDYGKEELAEDLGPIRRKKRAGSE